MTDRTLPEDRVAKLIEDATIRSCWSPGECRYLVEFVDNRKLVETVAKECILSVQREIIRNGNTPENQRSYLHVVDIAEKFGIKLPMDYYGDQK